MEQEAMKVSAEIAKAQLMVCKECFSWLPSKKGYKCILSGKKKLGSMTTCQFVDSRRAFVEKALSVATGVKSAV